MGIKPFVTTVTVTTAGTRTKVITASTLVVSVYFEAAEGNAGKIYVGDSAVSSTNYTAKLGAGAGFGISTDAQGKLGGELQLNTLYVDTSNSGDKVQVTYLYRMGSH